MALLRLRFSSNVMGLQSMFAAGTGGATTGATNDMEREGGAGLGAGGGGGAAFFGAGAFAFLLETDPADVLDMRRTDFLLALADGFRLGMAMEGGHKG